jgi:hypothetical protein
MDYPNRNPGSQTPRIVLFTSCSPDSACRNAGVKFRYCSHCKAPVAKRNFRRRHNHGYSNQEDLHAHEDSEAEDMRTGADDERKMNGPQSKKIKTANVVPPETNPSIWQEHVHEGPVKVNKLGQNRRLLWASLLEERPLTSDGESMSVWINKVLLVSDAEQPFPPREEPVMIAPKKDLSNQGRPQAPLKKRGRQE